MDQKIVDGTRERSRRPVRNKRYSRRAFGEEKRPPKRLFTPEIKRFLKDWLIRRRDNPYPNRDEKKSLAIQTGLTYIQVCNWFANWRRKLKNAGKEPQRKTWGHLIKTYNSQVQGNVEHFSICSDDSIWEEHEVNEADQALRVEEDFSQYISKKIFECNSKTCADHNYTNQNGTENNNCESQNQCFFISSTTTDNEVECNPFSQHINKYKNHIMEKYLRDCQKPIDGEQIELKDTEKPSMISKWLESAANFRPSENNYLNWPKSQKKKFKTTHPNSDLYQQHGKEELDAAEALTKLANARADTKSN